MHTFTVLVTSQSYVYDVGSLGLYNGKYMETQSLILLIHGLKKIRYLIARTQPGANMIKGK